MLVTTVPFTRNSYRHIVRFVLPKRTGVLLKRVEHAFGDRRPCSPDSIKEINHPSLSCQPCPDEVLTTSGPGSPCSKLDRKPSVVFAICAGLNSSSNTTSSHSGGAPSRKKLPSKLSACNETRLWTHTDD